jgi:thioredoxin 1
MAASKVPYINDSDFKTAVLESSVPVLLDFTAVWCQPCKQIAPLLDQVQDQLGAKIKVVKIDIDHNMETPSSFGVQSIPTLLLFKDGKVVDRRVGALNKAALDQFVGRVVA